jgi:hypothetical protein
MKKEKGLNPFFRFVLPSLSIIGAGIMVAASIFRHKISNVWYLILFALVMIPYYIIGIKVLSLGSLAIYGMFLAIVLPPARGSKAVLTVVFVAVLLNALFYYLPLLKAVPSGISISICAIAAALFGAVLFPIPMEKEGEA